MWVSLSDRLREWWILVIALCVLVAGAFLMSRPAPAPAQAPVAEQTRPAGPQVASRDNPAAPAAKQQPPAASPPAKQPAQAAPAASPPPPAAQPDAAHDSHAAAPA